MLKPFVEESLLETSFHKNTIRYLNCEHIFIRIYCYLTVDLSRFFLELFWHRKAKSLPHLFCYFYGFRMV